MSANKQTQANALMVDDSTGEIKNEQLVVHVNEPSDVYTYNIPVSAGLSTIDSGMSDDPWYILYWLDHYDYLPESTKQIVQQSVEKNPYLDNFSESVAALLDVEFIKDNSTVPVSDIGSNITGYTYSRVLDYVVTRQNAEMTNEMSIKVNNMFKRNMTFIKDDSGIASKLSLDTHGRNLVTDSQHYVRLKSILNDLEQMINEKMGVMYNVLKFIQNNTSSIKFFQWKQRLLVENSLLIVDINGSPVETFSDTVTQSISALQSTDIRVTS